MRFKNLLLLTCCYFVVNSCSENEERQICPGTQIIKMKINGEEMNFTLYGRGIDLDNDGSGHTLSLYLIAGESNPQQNTHNVTLHLPFKKTGKNILENIHYLRVESVTSFEGDFTQSNVESKVTVNKNSCIRATFSGSMTINGNAVTISDGVIDHVYSDPFDSE